MSASDELKKLRSIGGWKDGRPPTFEEQMIERYGSWDAYLAESEAPMTEAELITALRRRPYDRAAREAARRLEELTRSGRCTRSR